MKQCPLPGWRHNTYVVDLEVADEVGLVGEVVPLDDHMSAGSSGDVTEAAILECRDPGADGQVDGAVAADEPALTDAHPCRPNPRHPASLRHQASIWGVIGRPSLCRRHWAVPTLRVILSPPRLTGRHRAILGSRRTALFTRSYYHRGI